MMNHINKAKDPIAKSGGIMFDSSIIFQFNRLPIRKGMKPKPNSNRFIILTHRTYHDLVVPFHGVL